MNAPMPGIAADLTATKVMERQADRLASHLRDRAHYDPVSLQKG